jgi:hypothetical protein
MSNPNVIRQGKDSKQKNVNCSDLQQLRLWFQREQRSYKTKMKYNLKRQHDLT